MLQMGGLSASFKARDPSLRHNFHMVNLNTQTHIVYLFRRLDENIQKKATNSLESCFQERVLLSVGFGFDNVSHDH